MRGLAVFVGCLAIAGCGDDGADISVSDLGPGPRCPYGGVVVSADGVEKEVCNGAPGADGRDGDAGPMGAVGPAGMDGRDGGSASSYHPTLRMNCTAVVGLEGVEGTNKVLMIYSVVRYSNGDAYVSCSATNAPSGPPPTSGENYFPSPLVGADVLGCEAISDYPPAGDGVIGRWYFTADHGPSAEYQDAESKGLTHSTYDFGEADCSIQIWTGSTWVNGTLEDL